MLLLILGSLALPGLAQGLPFLPVVYTAGSLGALAFLLWRGLRAVWPRPLPLSAAQGIEKKFPFLRDDITNSILLFEQTGSAMAGGGPSPALIRAQLKRTAEKAAAVKPTDVVDVKKGARHLRLLAPLALTLGLVLIIDFPLLGRALALVTHPFSGVSEAYTAFSLGQRSTIVVARGKPVVLRVLSAGKTAEKPTLTMWPEGRENARFAMEPEGSAAFVYRVASAQVSFRYQAASKGSASPIGAVRVVDPPDLDSLKLTLTPPPYTRLPTETQEGGRITALKGTLVAFEARTTQEVAEAEIVLNGGNRYPLGIEALRLTGSLLVLEPGTYSIRLKDSLGFENPDPVNYEIRIVPDRFPEATIIHPSADMEIIGDEVIPVVYTASDDFGLTTVRLVYQRNGEEHRIGLINPVDRRSVGPETFKWDLSGLALLPGEKVTFTIEVEDNDAISGPKKGSSRSIVLSVRDERGQASKEGEDTQRLADALLQLLADHLEERQKPESLEKRINEILAQTNKYLEHIGDRIDRLDLEALARNLASLKERVAQEPSEKVTQELERLALLAQDIAKGARTTEVEAMAREIRNRQRQLIDAFRQLKRPPTREDLQKIAEQVKKLEALLRSVMDALSKLATRLPDEFINSQELSSLDFQDMFGELSEMYKKLGEGDIPGALEAAQKLLSSLQEMMAALGRAGTRAGTSPFDRIQGEMSRQAGELDKILAEEKEIYSDTGLIGSAVSKAAEEETKRRLAGMLGQIKASLDRLRKALPEEEADTAGSLEKLIESGDLAKFNALLDELESQSRGMEAASEGVRKLRTMMDGLRAGAADVLGKGDREQFPSLSERQDSLKGRTQQFLEQVEAMAQLFPGMDTEALKDIEKAASSMGDAAGSLKREDAQGALPPEEEAIRRLSKSQQSMQQMAQQMGARMQAADRWGYPLVYDPRPGWYYGPWAPMPTLPQPEPGFPREKGYTGIDREEFEPPSKDAYQVPRRYRERIMDSMKQSAPQDYKKDVEHYLRGLAQ
ncbi:MAG: DUF4175 family protein [Syntrophorhabdales bacterium]